MDTADFADMSIAAAAAEAAEDVTNMLVDCASELVASMQTGSIGSPLKLRTRVRSYSF